MLSSLWGLCLLSSARAAVTVHGQIPLAQTSTAFDPEGTGIPVIQLAAYNDTVLNPPPIPDPRPGTAFTLVLPESRDGVYGLSIPQQGAFLGFSIEMSVINQLLGKNSTHLQVPFLNLMGNIQQRAGAINVRLGGNTQEFAALVDEIPFHSAVAKEQHDVLSTTRTPAVIYTRDLFYMMANISSLVNVNWYLGIPFNDTNWRLEIAELGQEIVGDRLIGLQAGNEPDLYARHERRPPTWGPEQYFNEFADLIEAIANNPRIPRKNILIGPSIATGDWVPQDVWETGYIDAFSSSLTALTVEHYPNNNCFEQFGVGAPQFPQHLFGGFLTHRAGQELVQPYLASTALAQAAGKPFIMFETNTASCGGYHGLSDSFGAALWALDYGMQMAYSNFSGALLHVGGQNVYYNPFTAPPTNQTAFNQWTIGAVYYSALVISEVFGSSNTSQILDLLGNEGNEYTPQYAIYESGQLARVALFNYVDDPSGGSDYVATITISDGRVPPEVKVKYLASPSVSTKTNITWAGQTFGNKFEVDGRLKGELDVVTITCDQAANACHIPMKAPAFGLVFLKDTDYTTDEESEVTFSTTAQTRTINTATYDPEVLATSNGGSGKERSQLGSTSKGSVSGAVGLRAFVPGLAVLLAMIAGSAVVMAAVVR